MSFSSIGNVMPGSTVAATVQFMFSLDVWLNTPVVEYKIIDETGRVYGSGAATSVSVSTGAVSVQALASANVSIPANIPVNEMGSSYQVVWTLTDGDLHSTLSEVIFVLSKVVALLGASDSIELHGALAQLYITLPVAYDFVGYQIFYGNYPHDTTVTPVDVVGSQVAVANGYQYVADFDTSLITAPGAALVPYSIVWTYYNTATIANKIQEAANLYVITPSILAAARDLQAIVNKSRTTVDGMPDVAFKMLDLMTFLHMGMENFNAFAHPTNFTMTNALGAIRAYWIQFSAIVALRSQYLVEGVKAFDFSGQSVSLSVDKSSFYESLASSIEGQLAEPCRQLKLLLSKRGLTGGDGSANPLKLAFGAIGAVGVTLSPVSNIRMGAGSNWWGLNRTMGLIGACVLLSEVLNYGSSFMA